MDKALTKRLKEAIQTGELWIPNNIALQDELRQFKRTGQLAPSLDSLDLRHRALGFEHWAFLNPSPDELELAIAVLQTILRINPQFSAWSNLGHIRASIDLSQPNLVLLNYTHEATFQKADQWNAFECVCRGLILERSTGRVIARPFDKFFNYGEVLPHPHATIAQVHEKLDGSLGIAYHYQGTWHMASRGSLTGDHAQWGQAQLDQLNLSSLGEDLTLLFEMITPPEAGLQDNLTVKYEWQGLCLLATRYRDTGEYRTPAADNITAATYGWRRPRTYGFEHMPALLAQAEQDTNFEGYVVEYSDGSRLKVKTPEYLKLNYLNSHFNKRLVWEAFHKGNAGYLDKLPDDVKGQANEWIEEFTLLVSQTLAAAQNMVDTELTGLPDRRSQAAIVTQWQPDFLRPLIFLLLDNKSERARQKAGDIVIGQAI